MVQSLSSLFSALGCLCSYPVKPSVKVVHLQKLKVGVIAEIISFMVCLCMAANHCQINTQVTTIV